MIAFEVSVNEQRICVASVGRAGVLSAIVNFCHSEGRGAELDKHDLWLSVGGLANDQHVHWTNPFEYLNVGDAVHIRVVDVQQTDPPSEHTGKEPWPPPPTPKTDGKGPSPPEPSDSYARAISAAREEASTRGNPEVEPEHLLLGIFTAQDPLVMEAFSRLGVSTEQVVNAIERELPPPTGKPTDIRESKMARRTLAFAQFEAQSTASQSVGAAHIVIGIIRAEAPVASRVLKNLGFNVYGFREEIFTIERERRPSGPA